MTKTFILWHISYILKGKHLIFSYDIHQQKQTVLGCQKLKVPDPKYWGHHNDIFGINDFFL